MPSSATGPGGGRPKLLFVGAFPRPGSDVFGGNVSDCQALLATSFPDQVRLVLLDSTQESVPAPPLYRRVLLAVRRGARFLRLFETEKPDAMLVFASSGFSFLEKAAFVTYGRARGVPTLLSIRSGHFIDHCRRSRLFRTVARLLAKRAARLLCQGETWRTFFTHELNVPHHLCEVVESWVASRDLLALGQSRAYRGRTPVRLLFLGWLERFKGVYELLEAVRALRSDPAVPPFHVLVGGTGSEERRMRDWIAQRGVADVVTLAGFLGGATKLNALRDSDVFVLPSHTEGLPNAMIEAMAAALPVVVTPVGSIPDVVRDEENGCVVQPRDSADLTRALKSLLTSVELREMLGRAAYATAKDRFDAERAADIITALVRDVHTSPPHRS